MTAEWRERHRKARQALTATCHNFGVEEMVLPADDDLLGDAVSVKKAVEKYLAVFEKCGKCQGSGKVVHHLANYGPAPPEMDWCPVCGGHGYLNPLCMDECGDCGGRGWNPCHHDRFGETKDECGACAGYGRINKVLENPSCPA